MAITATPFDVSDIDVPDDLAAILKKGGPRVGPPVTPIFDHVLSRHRKMVSSLRHQVWPPVVAIDPDEDEQIGRAHV